LRGGLELIFRNSELGLGWFSSDAIGQRGRSFWTALWAECRGRGGGVGGWLAGSLNDRVQRRCGQVSAWQGRCGVPWGWARVAS
jgi:hypothetical protein